MKKIPSVFQRNYDGDRLIRDEVVPGCEWVLDGLGLATGKWDGTACAVIGGRLFRRYDRKPDKRGNHKESPLGWIPCEESPDPNTGHWPGWMPVGDGPEDKWFREALRHATMTDPGFLDADKTYELVGPHFQSNHHAFGEDQFIAHGVEVLSEDPGTRTFESIRRMLEAAPFEGVVFWHLDGRKAKVKRKDYGLPWPLPEGVEKFLLGRKP